MCPWYFVLPVPVCFCFLLSRAAAPAGWCTSAALACEEREEREGRVDARVLLFEEETLFSFAVVACPADPL